MAVRCSQFLLLHPQTYQHPEAIKDVLCFKGLPNSSDTTENMPGHYTIQTDPTVKPVQHVCCKLTTKSRGNIEAIFHDMVDQGVTTPEIGPNEWVASLTYFRMPDRSLNVCLDMDLNKVLQSTNSR